MAFRNKLSGFVRGTLSGSSASSANAPEMHMFNTIRCMATKLFVGGMCYSFFLHNKPEVFKFIQSFVVLIINRTFRKSISSSR